MQNYLITGGQGFIGGKIARETGGTSYDLKSELDILDENLLKHACPALAGRDLAIEGIFHCAAKISVPESLLLPDEYHRTNVEGTQVVLKVAESIGAKIVFSSSAAVYGESSVEVDESAELVPKSPYAENKIDAEKLLENSSIPHVALRYFNVYGPGQSAQYAGVITNFIARAITGEDLVIYGDGEQVRDFVYVDDVVRANVLAMNYKNDSFEIFNIGSGVETTIKDLAETIIKLTGSISQIRYEPARAGDIVYSQADVTKAKDILGWKPETALVDGLAKTIEYYKKELEVEVLIAD